MKNAVVLWTGGKASFLAHHFAKKKFSIIELATFVPVEAAEFKAHPRPEMEEQARRLGLGLHFIEVAGLFREGYILGLKWIQTHHR